MKTASLFTLLSLCLICASFRSDSIHKPPTDDFATIYIYRGGQFYASAINYSIYVNGEKICKLSNNKYIEYKVKPGKLAITAQRGGIEVFKRETGLDLDTEAGKKYYVKGDVKSSLTRTRLEMSEVTENTANRDMKDMTVDKCQETMTN
ncbi:DUF2846 domain-containing protein [Spirosoma jeollabukense]